MAQAVRLNGKHFYTIEMETISHNGGPTGENQALVTRRANSATDELHEFETADFLDYLDGMGIPRNVVNLDTGHVFNPETRAFEDNGVWSRGREANEQFGRVLALLSAKK